LDCGGSATAFACDGLPSLNFRFGNCQLRKAVSEPPHSKNHRRADGAQPGGISIPLMWRFGPKKSNLTRSQRRPRRQNLGFCGRTF